MRKLQAVVGALALVAGCAKSDSTSPMSAADGAQFAKGGSGNNGTTLSITKTAQFVWVCFNGSPQLRLRGVVTVVNGGVLATTGLVVTDFVEEKLPNSPNWQTRVGPFDITSAGPSVIAAGATADYPYDFVFPFGPGDDAATFRNVGHATITNHSNYIGQAYGPTVRTTLIATSAPIGICDQEGGGGCTLTQGFWSTHGPVQLVITPISGTRRALPWAATSTRIWKP